MSCMDDAMSLSLLCLQRWLLPEIVSCIMAALKGEAGMSAALAVDVTVP